MAAGIREKQTGERVPRPRRAGGTGPSRPGRGSGAERSGAGRTLPPLRPPLSPRGGLRAPPRLRRGFAPSHPAWVSRQRGGGPSAAFSSPLRRRARGGGVLELRAAVLAEGPRAPGPEDVAVGAAEVWKAPPGRDLAGPGP